MNNEVTGKVVAVPPPKSGMGQRGPWMRQTVVIEYESGRYTQKLALECSNGKAESFGKLKIGQTVTVSYDVTSREWEGRYFTTANAFDFKVEGAAAQEPAAPAAEGGEDGEDGLPF